MFIQRSWVLCLGIWIKEVDHPALSSLEIHIPSLCLGERSVTGLQELVARVPTQVVDELPLRISVLV